MLKAMHKLAFSILRFVAYVVVHMTLCRLMSKSGWLKAHFPREVQRIILIRRDLSEDLMFSKIRLIRFQRLTLFAAPVFGSLADSFPINSTDRYLHWAVPISTVILPIWHRMLAQPRFRSPCRVQYRMSLNQGFCICPYFDNTVYQMSE
jgi:hypothetical protein